MMSFSARTKPIRKNAGAVVLLAALLASLPLSVSAHSPATQLSTRDSEPFPAATPANVVAVTRRVFPAVVRLDVARQQYRNGKPSVDRGIGSGVIIDQQGHVVTNFHVAGNAREIFVTLANKERVRGKLVGDDHWTDLAVVQLDLDEVKAKGITFAHADLGTSAALVPGQDVMAIGTPFGLARTMTLGTVSNAERTLYPDKLKIDDYEASGYSNWVQMDVPINPGNSGGPLVDLNGDVVGINTRGGAQNLNFAIPIDTVKPVVEAIIRTATPDALGHFERADLGIDLKPMQDLESFYKLDVDHGVLINGVIRFSGAQTAGVRPQDVLLAVNGVPTNVRFPEELAGVQQRLAALLVGKPATLSLQRDGKPLTVDVIPSRLRGVVGDESAAPSWGVSVREVTIAYANAAQLEKPGGLIVTGVSPQSPADKAGLDDGDVIEAVDRRSVDGLDALERMLTEDGPRMLTVRRGQSYRSVLIKPTATPKSATTRPNGD